LSAEDSTISYPLIRAIQETDFSFSFQGSIFINNTLSKAYNFLSISLLSLNFASIKIQTQEV